MGGRACECEQGCRVLAMQLLLSPTTCAVYMSEKPWHGLDAEKLRELMEALQVMEGKLSEVKDELTLEVKGAMAAQFDKLDMGALPSGVQVSFFSHLLLNPLS